MDKYPTLRKNVMIYRDEGKCTLLINPYRNSGQKLALLTDTEAKILNRFNGKARLSDISRSLGINAKSILRTIKKFSSKEWNAVRLLNMPVQEIIAKEEKETKYHNILLSIRSEVISAERANEVGVTLKEYHLNKIPDALGQFDNVETTVSHIYKDPHIILGGKNYGASFADVLMRERVIKKGMSILEVGGGTGIFGRSFLSEIRDKAPGIYKTIKYAFFDLSPTLLRSQQKIAKAHHRFTRFIQGDIERYDFGSQKFDLIIANEMIADLNTVKLNKTEIGNPVSLPPDKRKAGILIKNFNLNISDAPKNFLFNLGAVEFLSIIKMILKPKGKAYLVEYGSEWSYPQAAHLKGHVEYSIHFGQLKEFAKKFNMHPRVMCLKDFLPFNKKIAVINTACFSLINNYLLPFFGYKRLTRAVYTKEMMKEKIGEIFPRLSFVAFSYVGSRDTFLDPGGFLVLQLEL